MQTKIDTSVSENIVSKEEKDAFSLSFIHRKIGTFGRLAIEQLPGARKPNGHIWIRTHGQVARKYLEWMSWGRFMNTSEFNRQKNKKVELTQIQPDGPLKVKTTMKVSKRTHPIYNLQKRLIS